MNLIWSSWHKYQISINSTLNISCQFIISYRTSDVFWIEIINVKSWLIYSINNEILNLICRISRFFEISICLRSTLNNYVESSCLFTSWRITNFQYNICESLNSIRSNRQSTSISIYSQITRHSSNNIMIRDCAWRCWWLIIRSTITKNS